MKTAILITARLKSKRLPFKVLNEIKGKPMLYHMLERLKLAEKPEKIILCTSTVAQDDPLEEFSKNNAIECYRGHPDDVLFRLTEAAKKFNVDTVISCTADNPFVDPIYIDRLIDFHNDNGFDYTQSRGLPFGTFSYALRYEAMEKVCKIKDDVDTEIWGGFFTQSGIFSCGTMIVNDKTVSWPELRLSVDTPLDFKLIEKIFDYLYKPGSVFSLAEIVSLCRKYPDLPLTNATVVQKKRHAYAFKKNVNLK